MLSIYFPLIFSVVLTFTGNVALKGRAANLANNSCTYIIAKSNPWWRVTLQQPYKIVKVSITNRGDCCADRISGAEIRVGNSLVNDSFVYSFRVASVYSMLLGKTQKFRFSPVEGQYVNVLLPGVDRILTLYMVALIQSDQINVAPNGRATQSSVNRGSTACPSLAKNAIDGNRQYDLLKGSCTQTDTQSNPWWRVDLMKTYTIASVALTNCGDCCSEQLNGVVIHIGDSLESEGRTNPTDTGLQVFIQNILNCVPKTNGAFTGLERHGGK
uniref:Fucolectin tachylectin-4 pentraxin-1 domain-containing protein n=1 Tax=Cyprinus carpio carpio TaxID=630221 RepID=A0A8C1HXA9_CYPCA